MKSFLLIHQLKKSKIKICGIKTIPIVETCIKAGVDYFGLIFYEKSPRNVTKDEALNLINYAKSKKIIPVGVFVNHSMDELRNIIDQTQLSHIQLHGSEDFNYINLLKKELISKLLNVSQ